MQEVGRPSKFTPERRQAILDDITRAVPYELAAMSNGIRESTLYEWINRGWDDVDNGIDSDFAKFSESIKAIEKARIIYHSDKISQNIERWQSDAWMLERRWYKYYGANVHMQEMDERLKRIESIAKSKSEGKDNGIQET